MNSLYIFGIVRSGEDPAPTAEGFAACLRSVDEGGIAAIVGAAPEGCDFHGLEREQALRLLLRHQQVLEAAIAEATVLPVKFGTLAPDERAVRHMLVQGRGVLLEQLAEFADRVQMNVTATWPLDQVFAEIATDPDLTELRKQAQIGGDESKIQLGMTVKTMLEHRRAALSAELSRGLEGVYLGMITNDPADERTVLDASILMERGRLDAFDAALERLDAAAGGKLHLRSAGPLAPSAFATIEVQFPLRETIEKAWRTLELGPRAGASDIRAAYLRLARAHHPDISGVDAQTEARMGEVAQCYRLLMNLAKTCQGELRQGGEDTPVAIHVARRDTVGATDSILQENAA